MCSNASAGIFQRFQCFRRLAHEWKHFGWLQKITIDNKFYNLFQLHFYCCIYQILLFLLPLPLIPSGVTGAAVSAEKTSLALLDSPSSSGGTPRRSQVIRETFFLQRVLGLPQIPLQAWNLKKKSMQKSTIKKS